MERFKIGDLVKHKTGVGPKMAVEGCNKFGKVTCKWYDHTKREWEEERFPEETLELAKEEKPLRAEGFKSI